MRIIMDRDAVCAGDDMNHHREEFVVPDDITIAGLFEFLELNFIPRLPRNVKVFLLIFHHRELGAYFTKIQSFINGNISLSSIINSSEKDHEFYLHYYSHPDRYRKSFI